MNDLDSDEGWRLICEIVHTKPSTITRERMDLLKNVINETELVGGGWMYYVYEHINGQGQHKPMGGYTYTGRKGKSKKRQPALTYEDWDRVRKTNR